MIAGRHITVPALLLLAIWAAPQAPSAQTATLPDEIRGALERNATQLSPITVSWTKQARTSLSQTEALKVLHMSDRSSAGSFFAAKTRRSIWQDGKIYNWLRSGLDEDTEAEHSFDGSVLYMGSPGTRLPDGSLQPSLSKHAVASLPDQRPEARYMPDDYFDTIGLPLPTTVGDLKASRSCRSEIMSLLDSGAYLKAVEDVELDRRRVVRVTLVGPNPERLAADQVDLAKEEALVRTGPMTEEQIKRYLGTIRQKQALPATRVLAFYLDPEIHYAMRRREERYEDGTLLHRTNYEEYEKLEGRKVWLPRRYTVDHYTYWDIPSIVHESPIFSDVIEVSEFVLKPVPDEQFVLNYTAAGTWISDDTRPGKPLHFEIPAVTEEELDWALEAARSVPELELPPAPPTAEHTPGGEESQPLAPIPGALPRGKDRYWLPLIVANVVAMSALAMLAIWKYRRRRANRGE